MPSRTFRFGIKQWNGREAGLGHGIQFFLITNVAQCNIGCRPICFQLHSSQDAGGSGAAAAARCLMGKMT